MDISVLPLREPTAASFHPAHDLNPADHPGPCSIADQHAAPPRADFRVFVMDISYFSGKLEAYLRYKRLSVVRVPVWHVCRVRAMRVSSSRVRVFQLGEIGCRVIAGTH